MNPLSRVEHRFEANPFLSDVARSMNLAAFSGPADGGDMLISEPVLVRLHDSRVL